MPQPSNCRSSAGCRSQASPQACSSLTAARPMSISSGSAQARVSGRNHEPSSARSAASARQVFSGRSLGIEPSGLPIHGEDTLVEMTPPVFGASVRRVEDPRLIRGAGRYVDDVHPAGCLHAVFARSHLAHATIARLSLEAAKNAPGVVAAWSAADFEDLEPLEIEAPVDNTPLPARRVLAAGRTRYVGEAVAMLVAESRELAVDALERIDLELDPLPVVTDMEGALAKDAALLYPEFGTNLAFGKESKHGQVKRAFDRAAVLVKERLINQRLIPSALEPRGALAWIDNGRLTIELSSQSAYGVRDAVAASLRIDEADVRVIVEDVGGGFGSKGGCVGEEIAVAAAARRLNRPVKWIEERSENCAGTWHGRGQVQDVELAAQRDGTVLAVRSQVLADMGAHLEPYSAFVPTVVAELQTGCYRIPASQSTLRAVYTNATPTGPYRGAGRPEAAFLIERMMDRLAGELDLDPVEVRLRNFVRPSDFPYTNAAGSTYDSGNYQASLKRLVELADYPGLRRAQRTAREGGRLQGIGISTYVEEAAGFAEDRATVRLEPDGTITVITGSTPHGQGHQTTWAQLAADAFGLPFDKVRVLYGDTDQPAYAVGTFGSRSAAISGAAVHEGAVRLKRKVRALAAAAFEAATADIVVTDGRVHVRGVPTRFMTLTDIAEWAASADRTDELAVKASFDPPDTVFPFGAHLAYVEVDAETGSVKLLRYVAVDDCGPVINPMIVDGQLHGAIAQGVAQALYEGVVYDRDGQLLTGNLTTYLLPTAADLPEFETDRTETPTPHNPMGVKGIGEGGTTGSTPAVVNAVMDALRPLGIHQLDMPLTPFRIWGAVQTARSFRQSR
ncbi:MAG: xanthine dehydrogenase family protein molybdopterin-binding subunit [Chloroflexi bacterium]|nr:MAG: xanthine dehydrogenase family protein molybdopterin-binding subunit [Chloroflexota bacterium]